MEKKFGDGEKIWLYKYSVVYLVVFSVAQVWNTFFDANLLVSQLKFQEMKIKDNLKKEIICTKW